MEQASTALPGPVGHIDPETFEAARLRAVYLRKRAIDAAVSDAARGVRRLLRVLQSTLLRALAQRTRSRGDATCRS